MASLRGYLTQVKLVYTGLRNLESDPSRCTDASFLWHLRGVHIDLEWSVNSTDADPAREQLVINDWGWRTDDHLTTVAQWTASAPSTLSLSVHVLPRPLHGRIPICRADWFPFPPRTRLRINNNVIFCLRKTEDTDREYMLVLYILGQWKRVSSGLSRCSADATAETPLICHNPAYSDMDTSIKFISFSFDTHVQAVVASKSDATTTCLVHDYPTMISNRHRIVDRLLNVQLRSTWVFYFDGNDSCAMNAAP